MNRRSMIALTALLVVGFASPALAGSIYYAELLTSEPLGNYRVQLTTTQDLDPFEVMIGHDTGGDGLGDGFVSHDLGIDVSYTHVLNPAWMVGEIEKVWIHVAVIDDRLIGGSDPWGERETAVIEIDGGGGSIATLSDDAFANLISGDVTAAVDALAREVGLVASSDEGDYVVLASAIKVKFADVGGPHTSPIPEPSAALVYGAGVLVITTARRRRKS